MPKGVLPKHMNEAKFENKVEIEGRLTNIYQRGSTVMLVLCTRLPRGVDFPTIIFTGKEAREIVENYKVGDYVVVIGNIQSRMVVPERRAKAGKDGKEERRQMPYQKIFGESIRYSKPLMDEVVEGAPGTRYGNKNAFYLAGVVTGIWRPNIGSRVVMFTVFTSVNGHQSNVRMRYFLKPEVDQEKYLEKFPRGSNIAAYGTVQTERREKEGRGVFLETISCDEIVILP